MAVEFLADLMTRNTSSAVKFGFLEVRWKSFYPSLDAYYFLTWFSWMLGELAVEESCALGMAWWGLYIKCYGGLF